MTKRRWPKVLAIILILFVIFILTAPASLIKDPITDANLPIKLSGYQGQLLNGKIQNVFIKGLNYQNLSWQLKPLTALSGKFAAILELMDPRAELSVDVAFASQEDWQFADLKGRMALAPITELFPMLSFTKPQGELVFHDLAVTFNETQFTESVGTIEWQDANLTFNGQRIALGLITGQLSDDGENLYLDFNGNDGIAPKGQIKLTPLGVYTTEVTINTDALPVSMSWINNMGQRNPEGRLAISLKGSL